MMLGSEKLLLTLAVSSEHNGAPLKFEDVEILDMAVSDSWNGEKIGKQLETAAKKVGYDPEYVISDNASVMKKGIRCANFQQQRDIGHSMGMFLERTYKNDVEFVKYCKLMSEPKSKFNMKKIAYLLPPRQRTIARFINLNNWVLWSYKMLDVYSNLSNEEKDVFSFVPENASLIKELAEVLNCTSKIETICKNKGLSKDTVQECKNEVRNILFNGNERMRRIGVQIYNFLIEEGEVVKENKVHNNSSDIIESIFGKFKSRKSPNKLNGVTSHILALPLNTVLLGKNKKNFNFKTALENNKIKDINKWTEKNLTPNLTQLRIEKLKNYA